MPKDKPFLFRLETFTVDEALRRLKNEKPDEFENCWTQRKESAKILAGRLIHEDGTDEQWVPTILQNLSILLKAAERGESPLVRKECCFTLGTVVRRRGNLLTTQQVAGSLL